MKTNSVRGHEIEIISEIGQGSLPFYPANDAPNSEQLSRCVKKRIIIGIESENVVAEMFADVKEVARAAAEIENAQWRRAIEPKVLRTLDVDVDPIDNVFEAIDLRRVRLVRTFVSQVFELQPIDVVQNLTLIDGMGRAAEMFPGAGKQIRRKELPDLA